MLKVLIANVLDFEKHHGETRTMTIGLQVYGIRERNEIWVRSSSSTARPSKATIKNERCVDYTMIPYRIWSIPYSSERGT